MRLAEIGVVLARLRDEERVARAGVERAELAARLARGRLEAIQASIGRAVDLLEGLE